MMQRDVDVIDGHSSQYCERACVRFESFVFQKTCEPIRICSDACGIDFGRRKGESFTHEAGRARRDAPALVEDASDSGVMRMEVAGEGAEGVARIAFPPPFKLFAEFLAQIHGGIVPKAGAF